MVTTGPAPVPSRLREADMREGRGAMLSNMRVECEKQARERVRG